MRTDDTVITTFDDLYNVAQAYRLGRWVFRGQPDIDMPLIPRVGRLDVETHHEKWIFQQFVRDAAAYINPMPESEWELLALARHHGLPTRLMDWTENALVAAFFACYVDYQVDGVIYMLNCRDAVKSQVSPFEIETLMRYRPRHITRRIAAQRGLFTVHPNPREALEVGDEGAVRVHRAIVARSFKRKLRWNLSRFGMNLANLFPDLDGLTAHITWMFSDSDPSEEAMIE